MNKITEMAEAGDSIGGGLCQFLPQVKNQLVVMF